MHCQGGHGGDKYYLHVIALSIFILAARLELTVSAADCGLWHEPADTRQRVSRLGDLQRDSAVHRPGDHPIPQGLQELGCLLVWGKGGSRSSGMRDALDCLDYNNADMPMGTFRVPTLGMRARLNKI